MRRIVSVLLLSVTLSVLADDVIVIQRKGVKACAVKTKDIDSIYFCKEGQLPDSITFLHDTVVKCVASVDQWHYNIENAVVADYMNSVDYTAAGNDYSFTKVADYSNIETDYVKHRPAGVNITWDTLSQDQKIVLSCQLDGQPRQDTIAVPDRMCSYVVDNLFPDTRYDYRVLARGVAVKEGHFFTLGKVRMIDLPSVNNVRDLGGWTTDDGRTVRYGLIYRGAELNRPATLSHVENHQISSADSMYMVDKLRIRLELDMRDSRDMALDDSDQSNDANHTELGDSVEYYNQMVHFYTSYIKTYTYRMRWGQSISKIISYVRDGKAVYAHCTWGADRTGTLSMLILGVLGVSQSDIDKEYELTDFSVSRTRNNTEQNYWKGNWAYIKSLSGSTLKDKFATYLRMCGVTDDEINVLRTAMLK